MDNLLKEDGAFYLEKSSTFSNSSCFNSNVEKWQKLESRKRKEGWCVAGLFSASVHHSHSYLFSHYKRVKTKEVNVTLSTANHIISSLILLKNHNLNDVWNYMQSFTQLLLIQINGEKKSDTKTTIEQTLIIINIYIYIYIANTFSIAFTNIVRADL